MSDDRVLIADSLAGDTHAFSRLLQRHDDKMRGVAWRMASSAAAMDDVLQDAYLKAWRNLDTFRGDAAFSSWLYRIVYTTALDDVKKANRRRIVPLEAAGDLVAGVVADVGGGVVDSLALRGALATLPADQLAVVCLVDGEGRSYDDVAEMLGVSAGTIGSRLSRARAALRKQLEDTMGEGQ